MKLQILSVLALSAFLTACSCCCDDVPQPPEPAPVDCIVPGSVRDFSVNVGDRVYFDFDRYQVLPCGVETLRRQAEWLCKYPNYNVVVVGKCDERGTTDYNLALGARRAEAAKKLLVKCGIPESRITVCSDGKEKPVVCGSNEEAWRENRVAITVLDGCEPSCPNPAPAMETPPAQ